MDKQDDTVRRYLSERADLLAVIRLPDTAFKANAGTEVVTDILFLHKRQPGTVVKGETWTDTGERATPNGQARINEYFIRHPEMMLGTLTQERGMYRSDELTVTVELTEALLTGAVSRLPERILSRERTRPPPIQVDDSHLLRAKDGGYAEHQGKIVIRQGSQFIPASVADVSAGYSAPGRRGPDT